MYRSGMYKFTENTSAGEGFHEVKIMVWMHLKYDPLNSQVFYEVHEQKNKL